MAGGSLNALCGDYWADAYDKANKSISMLEDSKITFLDNFQRVYFFIFYSIIVSLSIVANVATFFTTFYRKIRLIQKTLISSLALSDIIVCIFYGFNNLINFTHPLMSWILGEFMCSYIPYMQIVGSVANSVTMSSFAVDRYRNVVHPLNRQWDPKLWLCIFSFFIIWIVSAGTAYPMYTLYAVIPTIVLVRNPNNTSFIADAYCITMCVAPKKSYQLLYYSIIFSIIFAPSMIMCMWLYYKIAQLIWRRRKPICVKPPNEPNRSVSAETSETKTSSTKTTPIVTQVNKCMTSVMRTSKLHMENKIRTFKIVLVIMLVFFVCRMPHWLYTLVRFSSATLGRDYFIASYALSCLLVFNTMLNPLLYSFLNETVKYLDACFVSIGEFIVNICCCCCSNTEFEDFEKDNPFAPEMYEHRASQSSSFVPRGGIAHVDLVDTRVRFQTAPNKDSTTQNCNTF